MTREEEIKKASVKANPDIVVRPGAKILRECCRLSFQQGAKWADDNPKLPWISVKESLPKQDEEVIVLCDELNTAPCYKISFGHIVDKTICKDYNGWNVPGVVYWFPMPKLPKE